MASRVTTYRFFRLPTLTALVALATWALACAGTGSSAKLPDDAPLHVSTSSAGVAVHNRAGLPLTDVRIVIVPYGPIAFEKSFARVEATERREISLGEFRSTDGAALNPRFIKPRTVRVSARDLVGKAYAVEIPWN